MSVFGTESQSKIFDTLSGIDDKSVVFPWGEIMFSILISVPIAYVVAAVDNRKWINNIGKILNVTKSFGDEDVWEFLFNSNDISPWLFVKDHKLDLLYFGEVRAFSESGHKRELILKNVEVYDIISDELLLTRDLIYLSRDQFDLTIEIPDIEGKDID